MQWQQQRCSWCISVFLFSKSQCSNEASNIYAIYQWQVYIVGYEMMRIKNNTELNDADSNNVRL